jgi:hypothetical protein
VENVNVITVSCAARGCKNKQSTTQSKESGVTFHRYDVAIGSSALQLSEVMNIVSERLSVLPQHCCEWTKLVSGIRIELHCRPFRNDKFGFRMESPYMTN